MFWEAEHAGAERAARQNGVRIRWNAPTRQDDVQMQIGMVDEAVAEHCRGLILAPDAPRAMMVPVERAMAAGLPTVIVGSALDLPAQKNLSYIVNDDDEIGLLAAQRIGEVLHGTGQIAIVGIDPQSLSSLATLRSFLAVLQDRFPGISVVDRRAGASNDVESELIVDQLLVSYPQVNAIFSLDQLGTVGSYLAVKSRSLTGKIKVIGVEQTDELVNAVRLRQVDAIIAENTYQMGYQAVQLLTHSTSTPPQIIKMAPLLITAANVDTPAAKHFIANRWSGDLQ